MKLRSLSLAAAALAALVPAALGHDFWIEPGTFQPQVGDVVGVRLQIGHPSEPEAYTRNPEHIAEFTMVGPLGEAAEGREPAELKRRDVPGREGADPAGLVRLAEEGRYVLAYRSNASSIEMTPAKFEAYLREKGLEAAISERRVRGESDTPGRESYSRCAKALFATAGAPVASGGPVDVPLGFPLELVLLEAPVIRSGAQSPAPHPVRLLYQGKPLGGALLHAERLGATPEGEARASIPAWTDENGEARLPLGPGSWKITSVHAVRTDGDPAHQWRSWWASLTFRTREAAPAAKTAAGR